MLKQFIIGVLSSATAHRLFPPSTNNGKSRGRGCILRLFAILIFIGLLCWALGYGIVAVPTYILLTLYAGLKFLTTNGFIALDKLFYPGFDAPATAVWGFWGLVGGAAIQGYREMRTYGRKKQGLLVALTPLLLLGLINTVKGINAPEEASYLVPLSKEEQKTTQPTQKTVDTATKQPTTDSKKKPTTRPKPIPTTTNQATTDTEKISPTRRIPVRTTKRQDSASPLPVKPTEPRSVPTQQNTVTTPAVELKPPTPSAPVNMVLIPAGEFQMGSNESDDEKPVHTVYTDAFYMDKYEVTNAQYKAFLQANPQWQKGKIASKYHDGDYLKHWNSNNYPSGKANHPVTFVSWYAAMAYAEWAGKRLPTEVEWEKAARGTLVGKKYPWGDSISSTRANYNKDIGDTTFVGKYSSNSYGLYDMAGNVLEWCLDRYDENFYGTASRQNPIAGGNIKGITGNFLNSTVTRVLRGGSWSVLAQNVRVADRTKGNPTLSYFGAGFRCVKVVTVSD
ncbi:MAG: SUMF1/EgtB/PvdO family nonheme iron enzyme [Candidatus Poribacteria bacterium]|nr:SUMF1/EgtB/PvdO family nonheme iron enzyme [Candidatus Poribacteria bacterium]